MINTEKTIDSLNRHGFIAESIEPNMLAGKLKAILPSGASLGVGGSQTLQELGILRELVNLGYNVLSSATSDVSWEQLCEQSRAADYYMSSSNAITESGELINIDGRGNRVANMIYGAGTVIIVAGENKICKDVASGISRIKNIAAPLNCKRLNRKTPCVVSGKCEDCNSPERICRATVILDRPCGKTKIYVFIVKGSYGY